MPHGCPCSLFRQNAQNASVAQKPLPAGSIPGQTPHRQARMGHVRNFHRILHGRKMVRTDADDVKLGFIAQLGLKVSCQTGRHPDRVIGLPKWNGKNNCVHTASSLT